MNKKHNRRDGLSLSLNQSPRDEVTIIPNLEFISGSFIGSCLHGQCSLNTSPEKFRDVPSFLSEINGRFKICSYASVLDARKDYAVSALAYDFLGELLGLELYGLRKSLKNTLLGSSYNVSKEEFFLFYRIKDLGSDPVIVNPGIEVLTRDSFSNHPLEVKGKLRGLFEKRMSSVKENTDAERFTDDDYYTTTAIVVPGDNLLSLDLREGGKKKWIFDCWKKLQEELGTLAIHIPECFRDTA
ncbi:hypothetical protein COU61_00685 [Candidatus Pacearchaeota archaeon CG10_big_fil_rev_8_21_14_0_10_35_13]|nr:MAG: hypothetical protein COU61_00685 [Candidatus Pacearchaeota archaeon CG10_big_fil_rev_8_21_14_0_10_35_13]